MDAQNHNVAEGECIVGCVGFVFNDACVHVNIIVTSGKSCSVPHKLGDVSSQLVERYGFGVDHGCVGVGGDREGFIEGGLIRNGHVDGHRLSRNYVSGRRDVNAGDGYVMWVIRNVGEEAVNHVVADRISKYVNNLRIVVWWFAVHA